MCFQKEFEEIKKISVVIPIYNEEQSLPKLLERTLAACHVLPQQYELILVDDGSKDSSVKLMLTAAENLSNNIIVVILNRNYGQHIAIMAGFKQARGDLIITLDADLQNPPEEIPNIVQVAEKGYDVVWTRRINRQDSLFRKFSATMLNAILNKATGKIMGDYGCMLRAYRRNIINAILQCNEYSTFIPILANNFAKRIIEIDVAHAEREFGNSKYSFTKLIKLMFDLLIGLTSTPLRLLSIIGSIFILLGVLITIIMINLRFLFGAIWATNGILTLSAIIFIFMGIQCITMGLLGEYIGNIYNNINDKPNYFIHKIVCVKEHKHIKNNNNNDNDKIL